MWRSLLFVPALNDRLIQGAPQRGADAIVLDLEAAVPPDRKAEARARLSATVPVVRAPGITVAVRVNPPEETGAADIAAAVDAGADTIVLPRATPASTTAAAAEAGDDVHLVPLVEDPRGVLDALAIAEAAPTVVGLGLGVEDYATAMGTMPTPALLTHAAFQVIQAARAADKAPLVLADTIAEFRDLPRFQAAADAARALGSAGSFAIHPAQVAILNRTFSPSAEERETAARIVQAAEAARRQGLAIAKLDGRMIDAPVEARARAVLARAVSD